jgi:hypothetical protein
VLAVLSRVMLDVRVSVMLDSGAVLDAAQRSTVRVRIGSDARVAISLVVMAGVRHPVT